MLWVVWNSDALNRTHFWLLEAFPHTAGDKVLGKLLILNKVTVFQRHSRSIPRTTSSLAGCSPKPRARQTSSI